MRKLIVKMSVSLDGFVADANGKSDWVFKTGDEQSKEWSVAQISDAGLIIMGRKSFEAMAPYWPTSTDVFATPMNQIPKAVFTRKGFKGLNFGHEPSATEASWASATIIKDDIAESITELKSKDGKPIVAIGGAGFVRSLIATGLVDEYRLGTHPVALGKGLAIFGELANPLYLKLVDLQHFRGGTIGRRYIK